MDKGIGKEARSAAWGTEIAKRLIIKRQLRAAGVQIPPEWLLDLHALRSFRSSVEYVRLTTLDDTKYPTFAVEPWL